MAEITEENFLEQVKKILRYHDSLGIREYPRTRDLDNFLKKEADASRAGKTNKRPLSPDGKKPGALKHVFAPELSRKTTLNDVREEIGDCRRCALHETRTSIVFGQGNEKARLMLIADAPSNEDDRAELPLQGEAGSLLDRMLQAINLSREEVYITTLVKCFPGPDAKPGVNPINTCLPFLFRQIEIICPQVICTMGSLASQVLLHSRRSLFQLRGNFSNFNELCSSKLNGRILLMPSFPPALLLENPDLKKASWQDLQMIQKKLGGE